MDNKSDKFDDEEYRPSTETNTSAFSASESNGGGDLLSGKMPNIAEHLNRKNIIIAVGVLIGLFCIYKIADVLFAPGVPRHKTTTITNRQTTIKPATIQQAAQTMTATQMQPTQAVPTVNLDNRLNALEQQTNTEQANLDKLTSQMNDMQSTLSNLDGKLSALSDSIQMIAGQVAKQQATMEAKQAAKKRAYIAPLPIYYVRAMVPGRAWLATQDGGTVTVSLGNNLPGYGTVEVIDPNQGTLITSTGAIIGYSPSDS